MISLVAEFPTVRLWFCPALPKMILGQSRQAGDMSLRLGQRRYEMEKRNHIGSSLLDFLKEEASSKKPTRSR
jgi:hypothetical protein